MRELNGFAASHSLPSQIDWIPFFALFPFSPTHRVYRCTSLHINVYNFPVWITYIHTTLEICWVRSTFKYLAQFKEWISFGMANVRCVHNTTCNSIKCIVVEFNECTNDYTRRQRMPRTKVSIFTHIGMTAVQSTNKQSLRAVCASNFVRYAYS